VHRGDLVEREHGGGEVVEVGVLRHPARIERRSGAERALRAPSGAKHSRGKSARVAEGPHCMAEGTGAHVAGAGRPPPHHRRGRGPRVVDLGARRAGGLTPGRGWVDAGGFAEAFAEDLAGLFSARIRSRWMAAILIYTRCTPDLRMPRVPPAPTLVSGRSRNKEGAARGVVGEPALA
jgi:hypothetical protein